MNVKDESELAHCSECGRTHEPSNAEEVSDGREQIQCECGNYIVECDTCGGWVSVASAVSGPGGKPVHRDRECGIEPLTDGGQPEAVVEQKERSMYGTTARVTIEIEDDGHLSDEQRRELAIALLEEGQNTEYADWDDVHSVPTVGNRVI
ncbi:hypothetical protein ACFSUP_04305 [Gracilibacillus thailandensis]|uniref:hypothetical protein n=1 Tax=Gracilibacillus thailandensis TaxID=563735 RepID=UPI003631529F